MLSERESNQDCLCALTIAVTVSIHHGQQTNTVKLASKGKKMDLWTNIQAVEEYCLRYVAGYVFILLRGL